MIGYPGRSGHPRWQLILGMRCPRFPHGSSDARPSLQNIVRSKPPVASRITSTVRSSRRQEARASIPPASSLTTTPASPLSCLSGSLHRKQTSMRSLETSTPEKNLAAAVFVESKSFLLLCHWRPFLADTGSPRLRTKGPRQLFGLSLLVVSGRARRPSDFFALLNGPGPRSVCRAHPADSRTANKIQGPGIVPDPQVYSLSETSSPPQAPKRLRNHSAGAGADLPPRS